MGYESHWTGEVRISPPLTWAEIRDSRSPGLQDLKLRLTETVVDTATGQITTVAAIGIVPLTAEAYNGYTIEEELQSLLDAHPQHEFVGAITARGPEGNHWRYVVRDRRVERQEARLVWPDGEELT
ncbi:DUF6205 family protein [Streptomyces sp. H27-D2]|uniref:DUF6205 family protein n=1 Tax=Streptomyces sp. H27-D2 TaxID=3046304 RepID=UPI002DBEF98D|nr:DUF6205 family protein [Streptomyces sp. H27-D2]MEC4016049.1 DUF6205 family protein [Streptomyces sp. H27-D2]